MKLLPLIVASTVVIASSSSYAQDKTASNDHATCIDELLYEQKRRGGEEEKLGREKAKAAEAKGELKGLAALVMQLKEENEYLKGQNRFILDQYKLMADAISKALAAKQ